MKRIISFALALAFVLALAPAVQADVIVSPVELLIDSLDLKTILAMVGIVAVVSGLFLWFTRKK